MRHLFSAATGLLLLLYAAPAPAVHGADIELTAVFWLYPGAKDLLSAGKPAFYSIMFNTADETQAVLKLYANKLRIDLRVTADPTLLNGVESGVLADGESYMIVKSTSGATKGAEEIVHTYKTKSASTNLASPGFKAEKSPG